MWIASNEEVDDVRKTGLSIAAGLVLIVGVGVASASIRDGDGARGSGAKTLAYFVQKDVTDEEIPIVVSPDPPYTNVLEVDLPEVSGRQGYVGTATFTLVNFGAVDAEVHCAVGNRMGHELFVPVNQLSDPSLGGLPEQNVVTYTLTGFVRRGGSMALGCHVVSWVGSAQGRPAPEIGFRRGSLEVLYVPKLVDQTPSA